MTSRYYTHVIVIRRYLGIGNIRDKGTCKPSLNIMNVSSTSKHRFLISVQLFLCNRNFLIFFLCKNCYFYSDAAYNTASIQLLTKNYLNILLIYLNWFYRYAKFATCAHHLLKNKTQFSSVRPAYCQNIPVFISYCIDIRCIMPCFLQICYLIHDPYCFGLWFKIVWVFKKSILVQCLCSKSDDVLTKESTRAMSF